MRPLIFFLLLLLGWLHASLWLGKNGLRDYWQIKQAVTRIEANNCQLKLRNHQLQVEVNALVNDLDAIEERARLQLGMIKSGEDFYRLLPKYSNNQP